MAHLEDLLRKSNWKYKQKSQEDDEKKKERALGMSQEVGRKATSSQKSELEHERTAPDMTFERSSPPAPVIGSIPVPGAIARQRERFYSGIFSSSSSDENEDEYGVNIPGQSASYFKPRTMEAYSKYFEPLSMEGHLEKQSLENPNVWKKRWFVMKENKLYYYKERIDSTEISDASHCGVIQLDTVDSVTTAKDFGVGAFQISLESRKYVLRAESKDRMHDWLFNFQRSIANIVSVLLRSKTEQRNRLTSSFSRRSLCKSNRSISFDFQDFTTNFGSAVLDEFYGNKKEMTANGREDYETNFRSSPRRASSPLNIATYGPRSPLGMFPIDSVDAFGAEDEVDEDNYDTRCRGVQFEPSIREEDENEDEEHKPSENVPTLLRSSSPPIASGRYIPPHLRNRSTAVAVVASVTTADICEPSPSPSPAKPVGRWVPPHQREGFASRKSLESSFSLKSSATLISTCESTREFFFDDECSFTAGDEIHGVTSLLGVRKSMEDVCCCIPDLNNRMQTEFHQKQAIYAIFDGHCGVRAATFSNQRLVSYLSTHEAFFTDPRLAFEDCFRRIDKEFLEKAAIENISDGTTAAVVLIRGNRLLTANIGDSRAVVSIAGVALDVIREQTPGREDERARIERQGGWVKEERELQMSKLHSMDLSDPMIKRKAERVVRWVNIYRVNGELAVSRAIGDFEYKGQALVNYEYWAFPEGHDRKFYGDLIIPDPEFQEIEITPEVEFLVLACDGLWDTITSQEAVDHVSEKLREGYSTKEVSHSLANLAIRSGSSDNVSVVIVLLQRQRYQALA